MSHTDQATDERLVVYSDYVCPFCYLGKVSLERYLNGADQQLAIEWHPFDLRSRKRRDDRTINHDIDDGKGEAYYERARRNVERLAGDYDVDISLDISLGVDSWNAQQASLYVEREHPDALEAFHNAVFDALWQGNRDIGDPDVLADIAADVGIDPEAVRGAIADDDLAGELEGRFGAARDLGITGVPTFVHHENDDQHVARGAIPPEQFERLIEGV